MKILSLLISVFFISFGHAQIDTTVYKVDITWESSQSVKGNIRTIQWNSKTLNEQRKISIYEPVNFHKDSLYDVVITTDNQCASLANLLEDEMILNRIKPLIIVGVHNRESQAIDTIFHKYEIDFRMKEMLGDIWLSKNSELKNDSTILSLTNNRHENFKKWISIEISNFLESHYSTNTKENWTIGGFSNGGSFVTSLIESYPNSFRNVICMSPGEVSTSLSSDKNTFFICAGNEELSFHSTSLHLAKTLEKKGVQFEHRTYSCGHSYNMWLSYYLYCLRKIYKVTNKT